MKKLFIFLLWPFIFLLQDCTKSVDGVGHVYTTTTQQLGNSYLERDLDSTYLTIQLSPVITCYSYGSRVPAKPCEVLVNFTCDLSMPLNSYLRIQILRTINPERTLPVEPEQLSDNEMYIVISPRTQHVTLSSMYVNGSTTSVADIYRIGKIECLPKIL